MAESAATLTSPLSFGDNTTKIYLEGDKSAISEPYGGWQSDKEMEADEGPGRFVAAIVLGRFFLAPAAQAEETGFVGTAKHTWRRRAMPCPGDNDRTQGREVCNFGSARPPNP